MTYPLTRGHSPKKVKLTFENIGKITRTEARFKKKRVVEKIAVILPSEYNLRVPDANVIIKRHELIILLNNVLKELSPANLFIVANKEQKMFKSWLIMQIPTT